MSARRGRLDVELILIPPGCADEDQIIGINAVPGRLPAIRRLANEPVSSLIQRALHAVAGGGAVLATFSISTTQT